MLILDAGPCFLWLGFGGGSGPEKCIYELKFRM